MDNLPTPQRIHYELAHPQQIGLKRLVALTRDYHRLSTATADSSRAKYHAWYYRLAAECERRGLDLTRIVQR
jgi:hypothetical protein